MLLTVVNSDKSSLTALNVMRGVGIMLVCSLFMGGMKGAKELKSVVMGRDKINWKRCAVISFIFIFYILDFTKLCGAWTTPVSAGPASSDPRPPTASKTS